MKSDNRIHALRVCRGMTLQELADRSGCSKSYIWELENRDPPRPSGEKLAAIADALDITIDYLLRPDAETAAEAVDNAFFQRYLALPDGDKRIVRELVNGLRER